MIATALFTPTMTCGSAQSDSRMLPQGNGERVQIFAFTDEHSNAGRLGDPNQAWRDATLDRHPLLIVISS
jgi:hypothetical protein